MSSNGTDYFDVFIVAILWGCTNPFLRKGAVEEDEKVRLQQLQLQQQQELLKEEENRKLGASTDLNTTTSTTSSNSSDCEKNGEKIVNQGNNNYIDSSDDSYVRIEEDEEQVSLSPIFESSYSYQSTSIDYGINAAIGKDQYNDQKRLSSSPSPSSPSLTPTKSSPQSDDYKLYQETNIHMPSSSNSSNYTTNGELPQQTQPQSKSQTQTRTSYAKGMIIQFISKFCHCPNNLLTTLSRFHPRTLLKSFISSIVYELQKFTKPSIAIPFLLNQSSAVFYFRLIATSDLTNVAYCQAMSMAIEGIVSYLLGERMSNPYRGFGGAFVVTCGVAICLFSKDIESYLNGGGGDDNDDVGGYYGNNEYNDNNGQRQLNDGWSTMGELWQSSNNDGSNLFEISPFVFWYALCGVIHWIFRLFHIG